MASDRDLEEFQAHFSQISVSNFPQVELDKNAAKEHKTLKNLFKINDPNQESESEFTGYIQTRSVFRLSKRPVAYKILQNLYGTNSMFEHEIIYSSYEGKIRTKKFSDYVNIMIKTDMVASKFITIYIRGLTGTVHVDQKTKKLVRRNLEAKKEGETKQKVESKQYSQYIKLNIELKKAASKDTLAHVNDWIKILFVLVSSSICAVYLLYLVKLSRKSKKKRIVKKQRHSLMSAIKMFDFGQIEGYKDNQLDGVRCSDSSDSDSSDQSGSRSTDSEEIGNMHEYIEDQ